MPYVLLVKEVRKGTTVKPFTSYRSVALMPCCEHQLRKKPYMFFAFKGSEGFAAYCGGRKTHHCGKCRAPFSVRVLFRVDETYEACGAATPYSTWVNFCTNKCKPDTERCGIRAHRRR